ncbi:hypothetical protein FPQ18DRAFT_424231 [Pyronema domesticum]|nr:hypothetical protein FPQ18DRAFT_424231 [Pyronema domesticum]
MHPPRLGYLPSSRNSSQKLLPEPRTVDLRPQTSASRTIHVECTRANTHHHLWDTVEPIINKGTPEVLAKSVDNSTMKDPRHPHGPVCKACFEKKFACQSRRNVETRDHRTKTVQTGDNKSPENSTMECPLHPPDPTFRACSKKRDASGQPCPQPHHNPHTNGSHTKPAPTEADILDIVVRTVTLKRRMEALQTQLKVVRALRRETVTLKKQTEVLETQLKGERTLRHEKEQEFTWRKHMNDSDALSPAQTKDHSVEKPPENSTIKDPRHPPGCICRGCSTKRPDSWKLEASLHQYHQSVGKPMENLMMKVESPYHPPGLPSIVLGGNTNAIKPNHPLSPGSQVEPVIDNSTLELLPKSSKHSMMNGLRHAHGLVCRGCCKKTTAPPASCRSNPPEPKD